MKKTSSLDASQFPFLTEGDCRSLLATAKFFDRFEPEREAFTRKAMNWSSRAERAPVVICHTPEVLQLLGARDKPLAISPANLDKVLTDKHSVSPELLSQLPTALQRPIMVFDSKTTGLVVMTELQHESKTCVAAVHLDKTLERMQVNEVKSFHPRASETHFVNWDRDGLTKYIDTKKSQAWFTTRGLQLPKVVQTSLDSGNKILTEASLVKTPPDFLLQCPEAGKEYRHEFLATASEETIRQLAFRCGSPAVTPTQHEQKKGFRL